MREEDRGIGGERLFFRLSRVGTAAHHSPNDKMKGNMEEQNGKKRQTALVTSVGNLATLSVDF